MRVTTIALTLLLVVCAASAAPGVDWHQVAARVAADRELRSPTTAINGKVRAPLGHQTPRWLQVVDVSTLALSTALLAWDACQTGSLAANEWRDFRGGPRFESGLASHVIGFHPTPTAVYGYFASAVALNTLAWWLLPDGWRSAAPLAVIVGQAVVIRRNFVSAPWCNPTR